MAPLVDEMLSRIEAEVRRYERVITYWRVFGPQLEGAVCASLRETTAAVTRQCGLAQVLHLAPRQPLHPAQPQAYLGIFTWLCCEVSMT